MVLVNVLELLFALLGISVVAKICQLPDNNNKPKRRQSKKTSFVALSYLINSMAHIVGNGRKKHKIIQKKRVKVLNISGFQVPMNGNGGERK